MDLLSKNKSAVWVEKSLNQAASAKDGATKKKKEMIIIFFFFILIVYFKYKN